jgi:hypothetical protein
MQFHVHPSSGALQDSEGSIEKGVGSRPVDLNASLAETTKAINSAPLPSTKGVFGTNASEPYWVGEHKTAGGPYTIQHSSTVFGSHTLQLLNPTNVKSGYASFSYSVKNDGTLDLKHIDTTSGDGGRGPKGSGAMLTYELARLAKNNQLPGQDGPIQTIKVPAATPELGPTGKGGGKDYWKSLGFEPADQKLLALSHIAGWTHLSGSVDSVLNASKTKMKENWSNYNDRTWSDYFGG